MPVPAECLHDQVIKLTKAEQNLINDEKEPRFFGDKQRQQGVDVDALDLQMEEQKVRKAAEIESDRKYQIESDNKCKAEQRRDEMEQYQRRTAGEQINNYRQMHQSKELRREYDLSDPNYLRKSLPMCTGDNDPRIRSKGSLLRFDSEDYNGERKKKEAIKLRQCLEDQIREKEEIKAREKLADKKWQNNTSVDNELSTKYSELKEKSKTENIRQVQADNLSIADEKRNEKLSERNQNACQATELLIENSTVCKSVNNTSVEQKLQDIQEYQKLQILEKEKQKENELARDDYYVNLSGISSRLEQETAATLESKKRDESVRIREINKKLALEQRQRRKDLDRADHDCYPTDDFFAQFSRNSK